MDLPLSYTIRETSHRIINPFTPEKLALLGSAVRPRTGARIVDFCSGKGEMLATWARDHGVSGVGVDISTANVRLAGSRAVELGVADRVTFVHGDAGKYVAEEPVDITACIGATWIGNGVTGTVSLLERSLRPGGLMLIGEPFWQAEPPSQEAVEACHAESRADFETLPSLVRLFGDLDYDLVEMVLADEESWDRYCAAHWLNIREWLDENPEHALAPELRDELTNDPLRYVTYQRSLLGWGVFALMKR